MMSTTFEIAKKELRTLAYSPSGWLILIIVSLQLGTLLFDNISRRTGMAWQGDTNLSITFSIFFQLFDTGMVPGFLQSLYLYIPLITMGLMSYEFSRGTIKLLFSSPLSVR